MVSPYAQSERINGNKDMKATTKMVNIPTRRTVLHTFGGLNRTTAPAEGSTKSSFCEFAAMKNMSSDGYPAAQTRPVRYIYKPWNTSMSVVYQTVECIYNGGLFALFQKGDYVTRQGSYASYNGFVFSADDWDLTLPENTGKHQIVNMAAYIVIFPEGVWFDTVKAKEYIDNVDPETGESTVPFSDVAGRIALERSETSYTHILMYPCADNGTPAATCPSNGFIHGSGEAPTSLVNDGMYALYNADHSGANMYVWQGNATGQNGAGIMQTDNVFRLADAGTGESDFSTGFFVGDEVTLENISISTALVGIYQNIEFGPYATVIDVGEKYVTLRFADVDQASLVKYCGQLTAENTFSPLHTFSLSRPLPDIKYVTEWNNRLWGCGGENNSVIYASALGNPRCWSVYENTAADSYWMNVDDGEEWTGAATFEDHAYLFKQNKMWKIFGNKPSNFQSAVYDFGTIANKSIATVGNMMVWASRDGIYAYNGGLPKKISYKLGDENFYGDCVAWECNNKYYLYCSRVENPERKDYTIYVYDVETGLWHEESAPVGDIYMSGLQGACNLPEETVISSIDGLLGLTGAGIPNPPGPHISPASYDTAIKWSFDTPEFASYDPDYKYICKTQISFELEENATATVTAFYDGSDVPYVIGHFSAGRRRTELLPARLRRCQRVKLRVEGSGFIKIYSISYQTEGGSEYGRRKI